MNLDEIYEFEKTVREFNDKIKTDKYNNKGDKMRNRKDKFWIVIKNSLPTIPTTVSVTHNSFESAIGEARRLSRRESGSEFVVMESIKSFQKNDITETDYIFPTYKFDGKLIC